MGTAESLAVAALIGLLSYAIDRGLAFHICLYSAATSRERFTAEEAYRQIHDPFLQLPKVFLVIALVLLSFFLAREGGYDRIGNIIALCGVAFAYVGVCLVAAIKAFRKTPFSDLRGH